MASSLFHLTTSTKLQPLISAIPPQSAKVAKVALFNKEAYWSKINEEITAHIRRAIPLHTPAVVHRPISDIIASAPRTMAPAFSVAVFDLIGDKSRPDEQAMAVAAALHVMYARSWAHEYLPHLLERRSPAMYNANIELLSGDAIAPLGYEMVANSVVGDGKEAEEEAGRLISVVVEMSRSMGAQGYVQGQYMHVGWTRGHMGHESTNGSSWTQEAQLVSRKKEGELYACGAVCGAIVGGAGEAEVERLRRYGLCVGTIHGMLQGTGWNKGVSASNKEMIMKAVDALRDSALMELQGYGESRANAISSILDMSCSFEGSFQGEKV